MKLTYLQFLVSYNVQAYNTMNQTATLKETQIISYFGTAFLEYDVFGKDKNWLLSSLRDLVILCILMLQLL